MVVYGNNKSIGTPFTSFIKAIVFARRMKKETGYKWHITTYKHFIGGNKNAD